LFKSLKVSDDKDSITKCANAGIDYKDLVDHNFSGIISSSELGTIDKPSIVGQFDQRLLQSYYIDCLGMWKFE